MKARNHPQVVPNYNPVPPVKDTHTRVIKKHYKVGYAPYIATIFDTSNTSHMCALKISPKIYCLWVKKFL